MSVMQEQFASYACKVILNLKLLVKNNNEKKKYILILSTSSSRIGKIA